MLYKRLQSYIVYNRISKEHLSSEDLKKPEVAEQPYLTFLNSKSLNSFGNGIITIGL